MPEITASTKIVLGSIAAGAALITGLLGNILAANISAFFSGTAPKPTKRPVVLWAVFFVAATVSVVAGSITTFAPTTPVSPTGSGTPKIVVTNVGGVLQRQDTRNFFIVCRDTVELANTSDVATSIVAVGTELHIGDTVVKLDPTENGSTWSNDQVGVALNVWKTGPLTKKYANIRTLDGFETIVGEPLPIKIEARSTTPVYVDYALKFATALPLPQTISVVHVLRFPDHEDVQTDAMKCQ